MNNTPTMNNWPSAEDGYHRLLDSLNEAELSLYQQPNEPDVEINVTMMAQGQRFVLYADLSPNQQPVIKAVPTYRDVAPEIVEIVVRNRRSGHTYINRPVPVSIDHKIASIPHTGTGIPVWIWVNGKRVKFP